MAIILGRTVEPLKVHVTRGTQAMFGLKLWLDTAMAIPADLTGSVVEILVGEGTADADAWTAVVSGQTAMWTVPALATDVEWTTRRASLTVDGQVIAAGTVEVHQ